MLNEFAFFHIYYYSEYYIHVKNNTYMSSKSVKPLLPGDYMGYSSVKNIIRNARGNLSQAEFVELLKKHHRIKTSQGLISKYESGKTNPQSNIIDKCMEIIHEKNPGGEISMRALEVRMKKVLNGPTQAEARKAFAIILDSLA